MRPIIGRVAAALVATALTWLVGAMGVEVTEETRATLVEAVTLLGLGIWGILYAVIHKTLDRWLNQAGTGSQPNAET